MKLTEQELNMFKSLSESGMGKNLIEYYERLIDHVCNSRYWGPNDTKESTQKVSKVIEELLINKIRVQNKPKEAEVNQFT